MQQPVPSVSAAPMPVYLCPFCSARADPRDAAQSCSACGRTFLLRLGPALDPRVLPPPVDPTAPTVTVKWASVLTYQIGSLRPYGVGMGTADPIAALVPLNESGVNYADIGSLTFWRKPELARALLIGLPLALIVAALVASGAVAAASIFAVPLLIVLYRGLVRRAHYVRVVGRHQTIELRFDRPFWRRERFYSELQRRAGLHPVPMP